MDGVNWTKSLCCTVGSTTVMKSMASTTVMKSMASTMS